MWRWAADSPPGWPPGVLFAGLFMSTTRAVLSLAPRTSAAASAAEMRSARVRSRSPDATDDIDRLLACSGDARVGRYATITHGHPAGKDRTAAGVPPGRGQLDRGKQRREKDDRGRVRA